MKEHACCRPYLGIDVAEVPRIVAALDRWGDRFLQRIYTERERARYAHKPLSLAARFAAKEAVMKALGTGVRGVGWKDIEVLPDPRGKPTLTLHARGALRAEQLGITLWEITLTHSRDIAIASVIGLAPPQRSAAP